MNTILHVFVEGIYDIKFFKDFIEKSDCLPISIKQPDGSSIDYNEIVYYKYRDLSKNEIVEALKTIKEQNTDYIVITDKDFKDKQQRKNEVVKPYSFDVNKTWLVSNVIEGWYLAGFNDSFCNRGDVRIKYKGSNTEKISKPEFKRIARKIRKTEVQLINFLSIRKSEFSFEEAKKRNQSLAKFYNHFRLKC
jgi:hypothetical protein